MEKTVKITTKSGLIFEGAAISVKPPILKEGEFSTDPSWWRVKEENGKYLFRCLSGALAGGECKTEITKEEFDKLHTGEITAKDICYKYNIG